MHAPADAEVAFHEREALVKQNVQYNLLQSNEQGSGVYKEGSQAEQTQQLRSHLVGSIFMEILIIADDLDRRMPNVLGCKLASSVNQRQHHIHVPAQVREEPESGTLQ